MHAKPKITKIDNDGQPRCPHCAASLWDCTVTVENLMTHYPFGGWLTIGPDAYAREGEQLTTHCGECHKPVAIGFNSDPENWYDWQVKFAAARTKKDDEFLNPDPGLRALDKAVRIQSFVHVGGPHG